ncbi:alpha/beta hydrolase [Lysinibacillus xylanilyticus]|uniref:Alpha/beta hydrolase n=1 Tax=Lysinibacillus xylanilyticus TaxID=582475 RepID=A0ABV3W1E4_9BACI
MQHVFHNGTDETKPIFLLLHGTGGNEQSLIGLAKEIDDTASILSVRGNVLENGMPRFFRRLAEGVFDLEDLIFRTKELNDFLLEAAQQYSFDRNRVVAIGYSNGANIAASLLFHFEDALTGAILHHPMVPRRGIELPALSSIPVFIGAGTNDPMCSAQESEDLQVLLTSAGAEVTTKWFHYGHQLTMPEVEAAKEWYKGIYSK